MSNTAIADGTLDRYTYLVRQDRAGNLQPLNTVTTNSSTSSGGNLSVNGDLSVSGSTTTHGTTNFGTFNNVGSFLINGGATIGLNNVTTTWGGTNPQLVVGTNNGANPGSLILSPNSDLFLGGPVTGAVSPVQTSGFTASKQYGTWICSPPGAGSLTVTLPAINNANVGAMYIFKNISTPGAGGTLILSTSGGINIDTATSNNEMTNATTTMNVMAIQSYLTTTPGVYAWAILNKIVG